MSEKLLNCEYFFHSQKAQHTRFYFFLHPQRLKKQEFHFISCYKSSKNINSIFCKLKKTQRHGFNFLQGN